jgi:hypothetical protein
MVRKGLHDKEIESLQHNLNQSVTLVARSQDQMIYELNNRLRDFGVHKNEAKSSYEYRIVAMKDEFSKANNIHSEMIAAREAELADVSTYILNYFS